MGSDMNIYNYSIGFIATGNEITTGSIQNTNTPKLASILYFMGYDIGQHILCNDDQDDIKAAISSLIINKHDIIIVIGGLGPTEDDLTSAAVASYVKRELVFFQESWDRIVQKYLAEDIKIPMNNKKQAYFPEGSYILKNMIGTADGCITKTSSNNYIITLPGPPTECFSMFDKKVKSYLSANFPITSREMYHWLLMGISESRLSELINALAERYDESFGYRAEFPYIELKLHSKHNSIKLKRLIGEVMKVIGPYNVGTCIESASSQLSSIIANKSISITVESYCTHGYINSRLFNYRELDGSYMVNLIATGMNKIYQKSNFSYDDLSIIIQVENKKNSTINEYSFISNIKIQQDLGKTLHYIYEWVSWKILETIRKELEDE